MTRGARQLAAATALLALLAGPGAPSAEVRAAAARALDSVRQRATR